MDTQTKKSERNENQARIAREYASHVAQLAFLARLGAAFDAAHAARSPR